MIPDPQHSTLLAIAQLFRDSGFSRLTCFDGSAEKNTRQQLSQRVVS
jgi:hypothetical protein